VQFSCDLRLSELLYLPLPSLPTTSQKSDSILIGSNSNQLLGGDDEIVAGGGKWEDEEERRFFEDVQDLKDFVPASVLGVEGTYEAGEDDAKELEQERLEREREEVRKLEEELERLGGKAEDSTVKQKLEDQEDDELVSFLSPIYYFIDVCLACQRQPRAHRKRLHLHSPLTWHLKGLHSY